MSKTGFLILNTLSFILSILINYLSNTGVFGGSSVSEVSESYQTLITPAGYAFGIWGFIYLWLAAFIGYQWYVYFKKSHTEVLSQTGWWFALANIANASWILAWTHHYIGLSVLIMFVLLLALIMLVLRYKMETWDAPVQIIAFVWWPMCWYTGWIILASITNVAAYLVALGYTGEPLGEETWTILMIAIGSLVYLLLIYARNMREAALVGAWGLIAIAVKHWDSLPNIQWTALICSVLLLAAAGYHGYKNRETAPLAKWKRGEV